MMRMKTIGIIAIGAGGLILIGVVLPPLWLLILAAIIIILIGLLCLNCR